MGKGKEKDGYFTIEDVSRILGAPLRRSGELVRDLNRELEYIGRKTIKQKISRRYFLRRFGLSEAELKRVGFIGKE